MKKLICVLLALALLCGCVCALADESVNFEPSITKLLDYSASDWVLTSYNRAALTVLLLLDLSQNNVISSDEMTALLANISLRGVSYVGRDGAMIHLIACDGENNMAVIYTPALSLANYVKLDNSITDASVVELIIANFCNDGYYKNDPSDILDVTLEILNALGGE